MLKTMFRSKKFWYTVAGVVAQVGAYMSGDATIIQAAQGVGVLIVGLVVGQGVADIGKSTPTE